VSVPPPVTFGQAVIRGLQRHCPHCNSTTLFDGYLQVRPTCPICGADNGRHRVDDIASYFTILLVGHIVIAPALAIPALWRMSLIGATGLLLVIVALVTLAALPFVKGGVIGALEATSDKPKT
jgi:uncharacterized protein (DUF983 family)